jgi:uncharacterized membrane-anchored protein
MANDFAREAEELARYYSELVRRLAQNGVRDVADLLALHERLNRALAAVSQQEIGWAAEQTQRLVADLVRMSANLEALRRLKESLERGAPGPAARDPR